MPDSRQDAKLRAYLAAERSELERIYNEVKWLVGEKLGRDPMGDEAGRRMVSDYYCAVLIEHGAGEWLSNQESIALLRARVLDEEAS